MCSFICLRILNVGRWLLVVVVVFRGEMAKAKTNMQINFNVFNGPCFYQRINKEKRIDLIELEMCASFCPVLVESYVFTPSSILSLSLSPLNYHKL